MRRSELLQGLREMKFATVVGRWKRHDLSRVEAAEVLGVTERTFRRWCRRFEEEGIAGLADRRLGKPSPKRVPEGWGERLEELYRERYNGFTAKHFDEHLVKDHGFTDSYTWAKSVLASAPARAAGAAARRASQEAAAPAARRHDAAPGRLAACLDPRPRRDPGPDRHDGRRDERDLLGSSRRRAR